MAGQIQPEYGDEQADARDETAEPVSRNLILRRERGQGNINLSCSADHEQDWQPYRVDPYVLLPYVMTIHTCWRVDTQEVFSMHSFFSFQSTVVLYNFPFLNPLHHHRK